MKPFKPLLTLKRKIQESIMKSHSSKFIELVNDSRARIKETDIHAVKTKQDHSEKFYLIDVREESEFSNGHLPNAIHLSKGMIEAKIENAIPEVDAEIILYCGGGYRSALAADNLQKMGYSQVISMDGGFGAWREAGYPIAK